MTMRTIWHFTLTVLVAFACLLPSRLPAQINPTNPYIIWNAEAPTNHPATNTAAVVSSTPQASTNAPIVLKPGQPTVASNPWMMLVGIAVPLLIALAKQEIPKLPGWALPILAPLLGAGADYLLGLAGMNNAGPLIGAAYGLAGVGLREIKDQVQQKAGDLAAPKPPPVP
jgi:hypothetical protein